MKSIVNTNGHSQLIMDTHHLLLKTTPAKQYINQRVKYKKNNDMHIHYPKVNLLITLFLANLGKLCK